MTRSFGMISCHPLRISEVRVDFEPREPVVLVVQAEVIAALASPEDFDSGPLLPRRDSVAHPERGFTVRDGAYLSARWPGDCHRFSRDLVALLRERVATGD